jgi:hypothetical protein
MEKLLYIYITIAIILFVICIMLKKYEPYNHVGFYNEIPPVPKIALHTIFVLKQNIPFLEEWIEYHKYIGVDRFYIYDNSKSIGNNGSSQGVNKYGLNYNDLISLSDNEIQKELDTILEKYPEIVYTKWEPRNDKNQVIYAQTLNINKHNRKYGKDTDWTIYTDTDEFLVSRDKMENGVPIKGFLKDILRDISKGKSNINKLVITQKKFGDRFCNIPKNFYEIFPTIKNLDTKDWAPKCIIYNRNFQYKHPSEFSIHDIPVKGEKEKTIYLDQNLLCFHHYNTNKKLREWMKGFYGRDDFEIGTDDSLKNFGTVLSTRINENFFNKNRGELIRDFC